jgi:hypothetical protein
LKTLPKQVLGSFLLAFALPIESLGTTDYFAL